jgi:flavin reductase (DIM6/NTAB) family NADH-FMN oxidoreductase RutF
MTATLPAAPDLSEDLQAYRYLWPTSRLDQSADWRPEGGRALVRPLPEPIDQIAADSRWPGFFPSPICLVTTAAGSRTALERVVGASIVNRFPYVIALSFCRERLSARHYVRQRFTAMLEEGGTAAVQFLAPGRALDSALGAIGTVPDEQADRRIESTGLATRTGTVADAPVFADAYLVYEARLVRPGTDFDGHPIYERPWIDAGSHRVYFLEITAIQLRADIADGRRQILWRSLPSWTPAPAADHGGPGPGRGLDAFGGYQKPYTPHYRFPSANTIAFEPDERRDGMAVMYLEPLAEDQVEVDNDRARWPCFFPSSVGMITTWGAEGVPNLMPCGSTTIVSRHPLIITPCVSYAGINERYAPRATLDIIRRTGRFGCGVPFIDARVLGAIKYAGNVSWTRNPDKVADAGLAFEAADGGAPVLPALPIQFDCRVAGEVRLGTHVMFLGEAVRIRVRADLTPDNPLEWCPWPTVAGVEAK